ncbi:hypothetical protein ABZ671_30665 [Micromonospora sp. NPDC006766]|uniref:hypothetical protein n=1 Tax=Micromonospora sp. NPDC006766 TaxID=3154778 RepID=UPI0033ED6050
MESRADDASRTSSLTDVLLHGHVPAPRRRLTRMGLGFVIAAVIAGAGCSQADGTPRQPASRGASSTAAAASPASPSMPPAGAETYRNVEKLCQVLNPSVLRESVGPVSNEQGEVRQASTDTNMTCTMTIGRLPDGLVVVVMATVGGPASGQPMYEGLRGVQEDSGPVTDISGLGAAAYTYSDELTGIHVVTYDNNLYLTVAASPLRLGAAMPGDIVNGLTRLAGTALSGLRA